MRILFVENKPSEAGVSEFHEYIQSQPHCWDAQFVPPTEDIVERCLLNRPDVVLIDIALTQDEEDAFDKVKAR
jgi:hypothetical protein